MKALIFAFALLGLVVAVAAGVVYAGYYDVAADDSHWAMTRSYLESARERSIARAAREVGTPPALEDPGLLATGAEHYAEMCESCHLAPDMDDTEARAGLNPKPPQLTESDMGRTPAQAFWIVKHGLKMTGMPAWGATHDDRSIWAMVAFVQKLPGLSRAQYDSLVARGREAGHSHAEGNAGDEHDSREHPHEDADHHGG